MQRLVTLLLAAMFGLVAGMAAVAQVTAPAAPSAAEQLAQDVTQGALRVTRGETVVECPLRHTAVDASVSGFIARVTVTQTFYNPVDEKIEAVYVFPLPHTAAVDGMTMVLGERKIVGLIKRRQDARQIYAQALAQGQTASLLEQERPNIFTQSVGNIKPKQEVKIIISYFDVLKYDQGSYEFHFPMVVGPRYNANAPFAGTGTKPATTAEIPAGAMLADGVNPPILAPGMRNGHDISLFVGIDAGVPVSNIICPNHQANVARPAVNKITAAIDPADSIPNKDFVLRYTVVGAQPAMALLATCPESSQGAFMLMVQPKLDEALAKAPPREICFVIDVSGSMMGANTEKSKAIMREFFKLSKAEDTLQVVTFADNARKVFPQPVPASEENVKKALNYTEGLNGSGGTEMLSGISMAMNEPADPKRVRIIVVLTDGDIGNEAEIVKAVSEKAGDLLRFWMVGVGSSPNRFLLDSVAKKSGGQSTVIELNTDPAKPVADIVERLHRAQIANAKLDWGGLEVFDVYPRKVPELWAGQPIVLFGRYMYGGAGTVTLTGTAEGQPVAYKLKVTLPDGDSPLHAVLAKVWARQKIEDLLAQVNYQEVPAVAEEVTQIALEHQLMSQYTSFVAVDQSEAANPSATIPRRLGIPVPIPEGTQFAGFFGEPVIDEGLHPMFDLKTELGAMDVNGLFSASTTPPAPSTKPASHLGNVPNDPNNPSPPRSPAPSTPGGVSKHMGSAPAGKSIKPGPGPVGPSGPAGIPGNLPMPPTIPSFGVSSGNRQLTGYVDLTARDDSLNPTGEYAGKPYSVPGFIADTRLKEAKAALAQAQEARKVDNLRDAWLKGQLALLLQVSNRGGDPDNVAADASQLLERLQGELTAAQVKTLPALGNKLDLVLRDMSLEEAVIAIAMATGVKMSLLAGSAADAAVLQNGRTPRVTYLTLKGSTVAEALDTLFTPYNITWQVVDGKVVVGTPRRMAGVSPWVYQVGQLALPIAKEVAGKDGAKVTQQALAQFLHVSHLVIGQYGDQALPANSAVYLDDNRLLVYGNAVTHAKIAAWLDYLATTRADWAKPFNGLTLTYTAGNEVNALRKLTLPRMIERAPMIVQEREEQARQQTIATLHTFSLRLYTAALGGKLDEEALTELRVAWNAPITWTPKAITAIPATAQPVTAEVVTPALAQKIHAEISSAWLIGEAALLLPKEQALRSLALYAEHHGTHDWNSVNHKPFQIRITMNAHTLGATDGSTVEEMLKLYTGSASNESVIATAFLAPRPQNAEQLTTLITRGTLEGDLTVLALLAARQYGGDTWETARLSVPNLCKSGRVSGEMIVALNRLAALPLPQTAK